MGPSQLLQVFDSTAGSLIRGACACHVGPQEGSKLTIMAVTGCGTVHILQPAATHEVTYPRYSPRDVRATDVRLDASAMRKEVVAYGRYRLLQPYSGSVVGPTSHWRQPSPGSLMRLNAAVCQAEYVGSDNGSREAEQTAQEGNLGKLCSLAFHLPI